MKTAASLIALRRRRKRSRKMPDTEENPNAGCAKKKIGSFLSARGAAIGAAVGSALGCGCTVDGALVFSGPISVTP